MKKKIATILTLIMICTIGLTSCGVPNAPEGYSTACPIISTISGDPVFYKLSQQFPDKNEYVSLDYDKTYFIYGEEEYYVLANSSTGDFSSNTDYSIYDIDNEHIGDSIKFSEKGLTKKAQWNCDTMFLDDNYLYFGIRLMESKTYLKFSADGFTDRTFFYKFEFYRFDLESGENESVELEVFFEKLQAFCL